VAKKLEEAITARDNALGTISIVKKVIREAREEAWKTHTHGHLVNLFDATLENVAEVVGERLQSRRAEVVVLCQHPHGLGICGKKEPCEDHTPGVLRQTVEDGVLDCFDTFLEGMRQSPDWTPPQRGAVREAIKAVRDTLKAPPFPKVAYDQSKPPTGSVQRISGTDVRFTVTMPEGKMRGEKVDVVQMGAKHIQRLASLAYLDGVINNETLVTALEQVFADAKRELEDANREIGRLNGELLHPSKPPKGGHIYVTVFALSHLYPAAATVCPRTMTPAEIARDAIRAIVMALPAVEAFKVVDAMRRELEEVPAPVVRNRRRRCTGCHLEESYGADGRLYRRHGNSTCRDGGHTFTEWEDFKSAGRATATVEELASSMPDGCMCAIDASVSPPVRRWSADCPVHTPTGAA
jgi:hypothetical protein